MNKEPYSAMKAFGLNTRGIRIGFIKVSFKCVIAWHYEDS